MTRKRLGRGGRNWGLKVLLALTSPALATVSCDSRFEFEAPSKSEGGTASGGTDSGYGGLMSGSGSGLVSGTEDGGNSGASSGGSSGGGSGGVGGAGIISGGASSGGSSGDMSAGGSAGAPNGGGADGSAGGGGEVCPERCALAKLTCLPASEQCVECLTDQDCLARGGVCGTRGASVNRCVQCVEDEDCRATEACGFSTFTCLPACSEGEDSQCDAAGLDCWEDAGHCVACWSNEDCSGEGQERCADDGSRCVECTDNDHCDGDQLCDRLTSTCVECRTSRDCGTTGACDYVTHSCI